MNNVLTAGKKKKPSPVELSAKGAELHPIADRHKRALEKARPDELGYVSLRSKDTFGCDVSLTIVPKFIKALDALIGEIDDRNYEFKPGGNEFPMRPDSSRLATI